MMSDNPCQACGRPYVEHQVMEEAGEIAHQHTTTGQLLRVERKVSKAGPPQQPVQIMVAPAPDLALRRLLVELGVVTEEQLAGIVELANRLPVLPASGEG